MCLHLNAYGTIANSYCVFRVVSGEQLVKLYDYNPKGSLLPVQSECCAQEINMMQHKTLFSK